MREDGPIVIDAKRPLGTVDWVSENKTNIEAMLETEGAVLVRNLNLRTEEAFQQFQNAYFGPGLDYLYRSTPRTTVMTGVYTASEYSPGLTVPMHSENAFQRDWPTVLMFYCLQPAVEGGATPLASLDDVTARIPTEIQNRFLSKGVRYIRNYTSGVDLPWETVFQSQSREEVSRYCTENEISYIWNDDGSLQTSQICQSFAIRPVDLKPIWFNQAHLFHPSSLDTRTRELLTRLVGPERLPRNATFGDGTPINNEDLDAVRAAFDNERKFFKWRLGDVLILNNMRVAHGRTPYRGRRRLLVAMGLPFSSVVRQTNLPNGGVLPNCATNKL